MAFSKMIEAIAIIAVIAVSSGRLPQILKAVQVAELKLLKESQASKWPKAMLLPVQK